MLAILSYTKKGICSGIQANEKASELVSVMNMCRNTFHNGTTTYKCYNFMKLLSTCNIFTAKFSGLSWMVKRYYIQDYPEYPGCVLRG